MCPIQPAQDLNLRPPAPETKALLLNYCSRENAKNTEPKKTIGFVAIIFIIGGILIEEAEPPALLPGCTYTHCRLVVINLFNQKL